MKIPSINNINRTYNYQKAQLQIAPKSQCDCFEYSKKNDISFGGLQDFVLKVQAKQLELEANNSYKEAEEYRENSETMLKRASKLQTESMIINADGAVLYKEIQRILNDARIKGFPNVVDRASGELIREFYDGDNGQFIMEEYDKDGSTIRKTIIDKNVTLVIKRNKSNNNDDGYSFDTLNGELLEFSKGLKIVKDGYRANENYSYFDKKLIAYDKKYKVMPEVKESSSEHFAFAEGKLDKYCNNWKLEKNKIEKSSEYHSFLNGKLQKVSIETEELFGQYRNAYKEFLYDSDDSILSCVKGLHQSRNKNENSTIRKMFKFSDFGLEKIYLEVTHPANCNEVEAQKMFRCAHDNVKGCAYNYRYAKDGTETAEKYITLNK